MKFSTEKPPNWSEIIAQFPVKWENGVIVTYGDTIHCHVDIGPQKTAHESVHVSRQTSMGVDKWWEEYFENSAFRLEEEVLAYKEEVKWVRKVYKDRNVRFKVISQICKDLSSPMYGKIISYSDAWKLFNN